jgi:hypothetical protein
VNSGPLTLTACAFWGRFLLGIVLLFCAPSVFSRDYFVSTKGWNSNAGDSADRAWLTLQHLNEVELAPGDRVFLEGGARYPGSLRPRFVSNSARTNVILFTSFGADRAIVDSGLLAGFHAANLGRLRIENLEFRGAGWQSNSTSGIELLITEARPREDITLDGVSISGYGGAGILVESHSPGHGFHHVEIRHFDLHENKLAGLIVSARGAPCHADFQITDGDCRSNFGDPFSGRHSGSGILLGGVTQAVVERCRAWENGALCRAREGGVGIWAYNSRRVVLRGNESHHNHSSGPADGGGFDFDEKVQDSIMENNYSHDNDGAGFLLAHAPRTGDFQHNTIRFNVSENDGRRNNYAGIDLWGEIRDSEIYHNTIFVSAASYGIPKAVRVFNYGIPANHARGVKFRNNLFYTRDRTPLIEVSAGQLEGARDLIFENNSYYNAGGWIEIRWGERAFRSLASWRETTGREKSGKFPSSMELDPQLWGPGGGGTLTHVDHRNRLAAYLLKASSPLMGQALDLRRIPGIEPADRDFFGNELRGLERFNIGCDQTTTKHE